MSQRSAASKATLHAFWRPRVDPGARSEAAAHILGHLHRHAGIVQAHNVEAGRKVQLEQGIHARANVEQVLQLGLLINKALRWRPHHGMVCQLGGLTGRGSLPLPNVNAR